MTEPVETWQQRSDRLQHTSALMAALGEAIDGAQSSLETDATAVLAALRAGGWTLQRADDVERDRRWAATARDLVLMVSDLDRNEHGRHAGDADVGDPTGVSRGNPLLPVGALLGYSIGGEDRPYVVPPREHAHDPAAWVATCSCPDQREAQGHDRYCPIHGEHGALEQGAAARVRRDNMEAIKHVNASGHVTLAAPAADLTSVRCTTCGRPASPHPYRHPITVMGGGRG